MAYPATFLAPNIVLGTLFSSQDSMLNTYKFQSLYYDLINNPNVKTLNLFSKKLHSTPLNGNCSDSAVTLLPYFFFQIAANSWGKNWGENGYFRIARGENECEIETFVIGAWGRITMEDMHNHHHHHRRRHI